MSLHAFKEPITLVSRCRPAASCTGSPPRIRYRLSNPPHRTIVSSSKLIAALDAAESGSASKHQRPEPEQNDIRGEEDVDDDSIEIVGPFFNASYGNRSKKTSGMANKPGINSSGI